jgi:HEAT repeat protein
MSNAIIFQQSFSASSYAEHSRKQRTTRGGRGVLLCLWLAVANSGCSSNKESSMDADARLHSSDAAVRYQAVTDLSTNHSSASVHLLIAALRDGDRGVRIVSADTLGRWRAKEATATLIDVLNDRDMLVRASAARALGEIGDDVATKPLVDALNEALTRRPKETYASFQWGADANAVASALKKITGKDFAFDISEWKRWLRSTNRQAK